jgi:hypothetical protein
MLVTDRDILAQREYYRDQARAAAKHELVRVALEARGPRERPGARALGWLGARLVRWGTTLRERHGEAVAASLPRPVHHAAFD